MNNVFESLGIMKMAFNNFGKRISIALLLSGTFALSACDQQPPESGSSADDIRKIVSTSLMSWETGDELDLTSTSHDELLFAFPGERTDLAGALRVFRFWQDKYEDPRVYVNRVLVDGNRFAAEYQFASTNKSTGKRSAMGTIAFGEVKDGRIILLKEYTDGRGSRMQEAGELPLQEGEEPFPWPDVDMKYPWSEP